MNVARMSHGVEVGIASALIALDQQMQQRRVDRAIRNSFVNLGQRWQGYCNRLVAELNASRRREAQLRKDLADAMAVIEAMERRH